MASGEAKKIEHEASVRRIESRDHNIYLANGIEPHRATESVPRSFVSDFASEELLKRKARQSEFQSILASRIGEPFFSDEGFILYRGDSVEYLKRLKASGANFDLTITSPPYNIGKEYEQPLPLSEYLTWCAEWMSQIYDLTTPTGGFWLNLGYLEVPGKGQCVPIPYLLWDKCPFYLIQEIVWRYGAGVSAKRKLSPRNEKWLFYVKNQDEYQFHLDRIRDPNVKYPNQKKNGKYRCNPLGKNPSDVWDFPKVTTGDKRSSKERTPHPAQFPLAVVERVVLAASSPCEVVFDPFAGSCSTGIAASALGRIFLGFELREDYCELAVERYKNFVRHKALGQSQMNLALSLGKG